ncbi:DUF4129 domain-containing protein [Halapricum desulfuricans]|uniref:Protein-glutamine gamma-glutamyltransferase-like C-terminal domain-containing protein n=1 Tax=Halapricum desulfuricans TaxID=2841257 RepID=A0A897MVX3_9EURY|nr:DUF4129 domain-containing protein [Halapricum desulfuricans]QSG04627.1 Uncharacterized protein HSR121_0270 [Halapricum desulfuricans]
MNRNQFIAVVVVALSVAGLAIAAATVSTPSSSEPGAGLGDEPGGSDSDESQRPPRPSADGGGNDDLLVLLGVVLFVASMIAALYVFVRAFTPRRAVIAILVVAVVAIASVLALSLLMDSVPQPGDDGLAGPNESDSGGGDGGRTPTEPPRDQTDVPPVVFGAFGLALLVLVGAIYRYSAGGTDLTVEGETGESGEPSSVQAVGEAAGQAADRLDSDGELENAIYRAWREMADALEVSSPRTTTPEEFAEVAVDAGMSREDVRELTRLFEDVRYGDTRPTPERERRAQDALRRIQQTYAGGGDE